MDRPLDPLPLLLELDARHDELLRRLDELDKDVARVLRETQLLIKKTEGASSQAAPASAAEQASVPRDLARAA